jgi:hypothetical protein
VIACCLAFDPQQVPDASASAVLPQHGPDVVERSTTATVALAGAPQQAETSASPRLLWVVDSVAMICSSNCLMIELARERQLSGEFRTGEFPSRFGPARGRAHPTALLAELSAPGFPDAETNRSKHSLDTLS